MTKNQLFLDKAITLCFYYWNRFGYGKKYNSVIISQFQYKFDFMNVRTSTGEYSVGIHHGEHLITIIICDRANAFKEDQKAFITHTLYSGKLGPDGNHYPNVCKLIHNPKSSKQFITSWELIKNLSQVKINGGSPNNVNRAPVLSIIFDKDGIINEIKEG